MKDKLVMFILIMLLVFQNVQLEKYNFEEKYNENLDLLEENIEKQKLDIFSSENNKIDYKLKKILDNNDVQNNLIAERLLVYSEKEKLTYEEIIPPIKYGNKYLHFIDNPNVSLLRELYLDPKTNYIFSDYEVNYNELIEFSNKNKLDSYEAQDIMEIGAVHEEYNIKGEGVKIGVIDSGVDFGSNDMINSAYIDDNGYLASFDVTGTGIATTSASLTPIISQGRTYLELENKELDVFIWEERSNKTTKQLGIQLQNLEITDIEHISLSDIYKVGIARQVSLVENMPTQYFIFVLADTLEVGVYDKMYIDMETSLAITLVQSGLILPSGKTFIQLSEFDITNDDAIGENNPIGAKDINGDGIFDISFGGLGNAYDPYGISNKFIVQGIDPSGEVIGMIYDSVGHGTSSASCIASDGIIDFPIFDTRITEEIENNKTVRLKGAAPDVKIIAHKAFQLSEFIVGWHWTAGHKLQEVNGQVIWIQENENLVQISSNSWGNGAVVPDDYMKGFDPYSMLLDLYSMKGDGEVLYENYPGVIFVVSAGNGAPGFGTTATPASAAMAITVGASTYYHFIDDNEGKNDLAWFSARGPTGYGGIKPDILAPGHTGFVNVPTIFGLGDGNYASGTFGGTSESAPRISGVIALMYEAYKNISLTPSFEMIRLVLKSSSSDLGFELNQQGAGLANAFDAVSKIIDNDIILASNYSSVMIGNNLNGIFNDTFGFSHPLVENRYLDTFTSINNTDLIEGVDFIMLNSNGTIVNTNVSNVIVNEKKLTFNASYNIISTNLIYDNKLENLPLSLTDYSLMEISLTIEENDWDTLSQFGINTPNVTIYDDSTGNIISDQLSFNTWSQIMYIGKPGGDFQGDPYITFEDPGYKNLIPAWDGLEYKVNIKLYEDIPNNEIISNLTDTSIELKHNYDENKSKFMTLNVNIGEKVLSNGIFIYNIFDPIYGEEKAYIDNDDGTYVYDQSNLINTFDWGYRPESGDFRYFSIRAPENATYLAVHVNWEKMGIAPHLYIFDQFGKIVKKTDVDYLGGGYYEFEMSDNNTQNILIDTSDKKRFYLMVHNSMLPNEIGPYKLNMLFRYLVVEEIPTPIPNYSQDIGADISDVLNVDVSGYNLNYFPELNIKSISAQVYQGEKVNLTKTIEFENLNLGVNEEFDLGKFDDTLIFNFTKGDKVSITLDLADNVDADMYIFKEGDFVIPENDLLQSTGATPGGYDEIGRFGVEENSTYIVYIDYITSLDNVDFNYNLIIDNKNGPVLEQYGEKIAIDTSLFPDAVYGVEFKILTNFDYIFVLNIEIKTENTDIFEVSLISPTEGKTYSNEMLIQWNIENERKTYTRIEVSNEEISYLEGDFIEGNNFTLDTTKYQNGEYNIKVLFSDYIYQIIIEITVLFENEITSSINLNISTTDNRNLSYLFYMFIFTLFFQVINRKNVRG